jgi:hypothetical protein
MSSGDIPVGTVETLDRRASEADDDLDALRRERRRHERERRELVRRYERLLDERDERIDELRESAPRRTLRNRLPFGLGDLFDRRC